jgi:hypothetical protein
MSYTPNFKDKRVRKRIRKVLGFLQSQMKVNKPRELSRNYLNKVFGKSCNPLTDYLRDNCLITTSNKYHFFASPMVKRQGRIDSGKCKEYKLNESIINHLINVCEFKQSDFDKALKSVRFNDLSTPTRPYCATSFGMLEIEVIKFGLGMESAEYEFGSMLDSKKITYTERSGRLFGGTQNLVKHIKQQLHYNHNYCYEYDIEACAPTLLLQYAKTLGLKNAPIIEFYLDNKSEVRNDLATNTGIDIKIIKQVINALFAGARTDGSIAKEINNIQQLRKFKANEFVKSLIKDIAVMWRHIKPSIGTRYKKTGGIETRVSPTTKWSVYFKLERQVLNVVIDYLCESSNDGVYEHDGWTTTKQINQNELITRVKDKTGYQIKLSEVALSDVVLIPWM